MWWLEKPEREKVENKLSAEPIPFVPRGAERRRIGGASLDVGRQWMLRRLAHLPPASARTVCGARMYIRYTMY
jgi:hypothetical protein